MQLHSGCQFIVGCTEKAYQHERGSLGFSWGCDERRGGGGGFSRYWLLEELPPGLGGWQPFPLCDKWVQLWSSVEDGGEWISTRPAEDSSNTATLSLPVSSSAVASTIPAAELSLLSLTLFLGPEENPSSLISWFSFLHLNQTWRGQIEYQEWF